MLPHVFVIWTNSFWCLVFHELCLSFGISCASSMLQAREMCAVQLNNDKHSDHARVHVKEHNWAATWDFQQCDMCDQQSLRSACAYAQSDQSLCLSLEYCMSVKLLNEPFGVSKLKRRLHMLVWVYTCQMSHCWKSHVKAHTCISDTFTW